MRWLLVYCDVNIMLDRIFDLAQCTDWIEARADDGKQRYVFAVSNVADSLASVARTYSIRRLIYVFFHIVSWSDA